MDKCIFNGRFCPFYDSKADFFIVSQLILIKKLYFCNKKVLYLIYVLFAR